MILKAEILFNDSEAQKYGQEEELIWDTGVFSLAEVSAIYPFIKDNVIIPEHTTMLFKAGDSLVINVPYHAIELIMTKIWGKPKTWEELLK